MAGAMTNPNDIKGAYKSSQQQLKVDPQQRLSAGPGRWPYSVHKQGTALDIRGRPSASTSTRLLSSWGFIFCFLESIFSVFVHANLAGRRSLRLVGRSIFTGSGQKRPRTVRVWTSITVYHNVSNPMELKQDDNLLRWKQGEQRVCPTSIKQRSHTASQWGVHASAYKLSLKTPHKLPSRTST